jgi:hypothetical protein
MFLGFIIIIISSSSSSSSSSSRTLFLFKMNVIEVCVIILLCAKLLDHVLPLLEGGNTWNNPPYDTILSQLLTHSVPLGRFQHCLSHPFSKWPFSKTFPISLFVSCFILRVTRPANRNVLQISQSSWITCNVINCVTRHVIPLRSK